MNPIASFKRLLKLVYFAVATRNPEKLSAVRRNLGVAVTGSNVELVKGCSAVFICVKPLEVKNVLEEIKAALAAGAHLVSIAASLTIEDIETVYNGPVTKAIPSFTQEVREGITLVCHNSKVMHKSEWMGKQ